MARQGLILSLLILAVTASGCIGGGGGGTNVDNYGDQAIAVHNIQVSPSEIFAGSTVRVRMSLSNVGQLPAELRVAKNDGVSRSNNIGSQILTNHCPDIFDVTDFSAATTNDSRTRTSYTLKPGYKARLNWELTQNSAEVPLNGYNCNMRFEVSFNYSVEAFRQIQVKANSDVAGSEELFAKSSKGPMKLEIEAIGSSAPKGAPTFLKGDNAEVLVQLTNKKPQESSFMGTVELAPPRLNARGVKFEKVNVSGNYEAAKAIASNIPGLSVSESDGTDMYRICPNPDSIPSSGKLTIYQGKSKVFRCGLDWNGESGTSWNGHDFSTVPSLKAEVYASADYTYVKNAGSRRVRVRYRGN